MNKPTQSVEAFKQDEHEALTFHKLKEPVPTAYVHEPEQWAMNFIEEMLQHTPAHSLLASQVFHELQRQLKDRHTTQHATQESYDVIAGLTEYLEGDPYPPAQTAPVQEPITDTEQINRGCWYKTNLTTPPEAQPAPVPKGWKLVPVEPTMEMVFAGQDAWSEALDARLEDKEPYGEENKAPMCARAAYRAMLALATPPAAQPAPVQHATFPEGYALHELPADYTGKLWIEGQVRYLHQLTAAQPAQQEPTISTEHGPWIPSTHPGEEGESYCKRCLLRDKFLGSRQCAPHIVPTPAAQQQEPVAWMDRDGDLYANEPDKNWCPPHYPLYTTPPAAQPAPVQEPVAWVPALYPGHYLRLTKPPESWKMIALYTAPQHQWTNLIRGVRVYGDKVVITVKGGNEAARSLCEQLLREKEQQDAT